VAGKGVSKTPDMAASQSAGVPGSPETFREILNRDREGTQGINSAQALFATQVATEAAEGMTSS
jgi:hypothetical protein